MNTERINIAKVVLMNLGAITISAANIQMALSIASLLLAISYTAWKWGNDIIKKKANLKKHNDAK
jgi:hypothetical protein